MAITKKEILKLGNLAKIGISDSEMKELEDYVLRISTLHHNLCTTH